MSRTMLLELEYDGTLFYGWQIQQRSKGNGLRVKINDTGQPRTVQGELEKALKKLFKKNIRVHSAGRTDRGVHARAQCVHFKTESKIPLANIKTALNSFLPADVRVRRVRTVRRDFHARFSAISKHYRYIISTRKDHPVFERNYFWQYTQRMNIEKMKKAASFLRGRHDFGVFAKEAAQYKDTQRTIHRLTITQRGPYIYFDIIADGFLRTMVRNIVSFLVRVATNEFTLAQAKKIVSAKVRYINRPAPSSGLYLLKVHY